MRKRELTGNPNGSLTPHPFIQKSRSFENGLLLLSKQFPLTFFAFDVLSSKSKDLTRKCYAKCRTIHERMLGGNEHPNTKVIK